MGIFQLASSFRSGARALQSAAKHAISCCNASLMKFVAGFLGSSPDACLRSFAMLLVDYVLFAFRLVCAWVIAPIVTNVLGLKLVRVAFFVVLAARWNPEDRGLQLLR